LSGRSSSFGEVAPPPPHPKVVQFRSCIHLEPRSFRSPCGVCYLSKVICFSRISGERFGLLFGFCGFFYFSFSPRLQIIVFSRCPLLRILTVVFSSTRPFLVPLPKIPRFSCILEPCFLPTQIYFLFPIEGVGFNYTASFPPFVHQSQETPVFQSPPQPSLNLWRLC